MKKRIIPATVDDLMEGWNVLDQMIRTEKPNEVRDEADREALHRMYRVERAAEFLDREIQRRNRDVMRRRLSDPGYGTESTDVAP